MASGGALRAHLIKAGWRMSQGPWGADSCWKRCRIGGHVWETESSEKTPSQEGRQGAAVHGAAGPPG